MEVAMLWMEVVVVVGANGKTFHTSLASYWWGGGGGGGGRQCVGITLALLGGGRRTLILHTSLSALLFLLFLAKSIALLHNAFLDC